MTPILIIAAALCVAVLIWHWLGDPQEKPEQQTIAEAIKERQLRDQRLRLLRKAYVLAKEELGEEPTQEQILLTRDQLMLQEQLEDW